MIYKNFKKEEQCSGMKKTENLHLIIITKIIQQKYLYVLNINIFKILFFSRAGNETNGLMEIRTEGLQL